MSRLLLLTGAGGGPLGPQRTPAQRAPLPPWPPGSYQRTPPDRPATRDLFYPRGNFCGLQLSNAPVVPGCNPARPQTVMACLLDNYPAGFQDWYLEAYADAGYTHLQRSLGHALYYGRSLDQYIALSQRARGAFGLFCDHWLLNGGEGTDFFLKVQNQDAAHWRPVLTPLVQRLLGAGVVDSACVAWQMDQLMQAAPGNPTLSVIQLVAELLPPSIPLYSHWVNHAMAWWRKVGTNPDGSDIGQVWYDAAHPGGLEVRDRFTWWQACQPYLTGGYYQGDTHLARTDPAQFQGRMRDTLNPFNGTGGGVTGRSQRHGDRPFAFVAYELTGQEQFNEPQPDGTGGCGEMEGDLVGCIMASCTADGVPGAFVNGYGNGARRPDGTAL